MSALAWDDGDYIDQCLGRGEAKKPLIGADDGWRCRWCNHQQHGFECTSCKCECSFTSRDDSWRPNGVESVPRQLNECMDQCGVDGWAAKAAFTNYRIKIALLNPKGTSTS